MRLKFKFIDREDQRRELISYLKNNTIEEQGVWISGPHNVGKTSLINEVKKSVPGKYIHISTDEYPYNYLEYFLAHISDKNIFHNNSFLYYISGNRTNIDSQLTTRFADYHNLHHEKIIELSHYLYSEVYCDRLHLLMEDLKSFIGINKIDGIIFDDFENCDPKSLSVIQLFISHIVSTRIPLCFVTNSEQTLHPTIAQFLLENLDIKDITVGAFDDVFFYEEFINSCASIPANSFTSSQIHRIFDATKGNPGELKRFMNILRLKGIFNHIDSSTSHKIDSAITEAESKSYIIPQTSYAKDILILLLIFQTPIRFELLLKLFDALYCQNEIVNNLLNDKVVDLIDQMNVEGIFTVNDEQTINFRKKTIKAHMYNLLISNDKARFFYICNTLINLIHNHWFVQNGCNIVVEMRINAFCQYLLKEDDYVRLNYELAQYFFCEGDYSEAVEIFQRIIDSLSDLDFAEIIYASNCLYIIGEYSMALSFINNVIYEKLTVEQKISFHIIRGKIRFIILDYGCIDDFENAKTLNAPLFNIDTQIEISNLLFMAYAENKNTLYRAKEEFNKSIILKSSHIAYAKLCRNALNVLTYDEALPHMLKGLSIAKSCHDDFEIAKGRHNIAFIKLMYIRDCSKLDGLKSAFQSVALFFQQHNAAHESAYSLNNYAVILMLQGKWESACNYLKKARILASSRYALYVINVNLLLSSCFPEVIEHLEMTEKLTLLYNKIKESNILDSRIQRKHLINFVIIALRYNDKRLAKFFLNECREHLYSSPSIARFNLLCKTLDEPICENSFDIGEANQYYRDFPFEPWILSFGHD